MRRALSAALFILLLGVVGMKNVLAQNQVATLQHNGSITGVFYGQNAFVSAYNASIDGDIITLSSGTFTKCDISKSIIVHGAGSIADTVTNVLPTIIPDEIKLLHSDVTIEGVCFTGSIACSYNGPNLNNLRFIKCNINYIHNTYGYHTSIMTNFHFVNCIIKQFGSWNFRGTSIINCVIRYTAYDHPDIFNPTNIYNSVILFSTDLPINNLIAYNSIISTASGNIVTNCTFNNCIGIETGETLLFEGQTAQNIMEVDSYDDVFETFDGTVSYDNIYQLKNDIATSFLGNDGTEVGVYGGMMPYCTRPNYMIIKSCNVAGRTNEENKLSVEIELLNPDE